MTHIHKFHIRGLNAFLPSVLEPTTQNEIYVNVDVPFARIKNTLPLMGVQL